MSEPKRPKDAMLISSVFGRGEDIIECGIGEMSAVFGEIEYKSELFPFDETDYYAKEMGGDLVRRFVAFTRLVAPGFLADIKRRTNDIERRQSGGGSRIINIDPGLLTAERVILASGKNYSHRIYLGGGIFADLTLIYKNGEFVALPWTYPDYGAKKVREMFCKLRLRYLEKVRE